jgi:DNA-binding MarR family transcriptional regulator
MAEEEFAVTGLQPSYAFIIMSVNINPGINIGEIAKIMMLKPSTVTRLIEKLENKQLITKKSEGKYSLLYPTDKSLELDSAIKKAWMNLYNRYVMILGEKFAKEITNMIFDAAIKLEKE